MCRKKGGYCPWRKVEVEMRLTKRGIADKIYSRSDNKVEIKIQKQTGKGKRTHFSLHDQYSAKKIRYRLSMSRDLNTRIKGRSNRNSRLPQKFSTLLDVGKT